MMNTYNDKHMHIQIHEDFKEQLGLALQFSGAWKVPSSEISSAHSSLETQVVVLLRRLGWRNGFARHHYYCCGELNNDIHL